MTVVECAGEALHTAHDEVTVTSGFEFGGTVGTHVAAKILSKKTKQNHDDKNRNQDLQRMSKLKN